MCFSATASFTAAAFLTIVGSASLIQSAPMQRCLALIPLFFALQQCLEGVTWLLLNRGITHSNLLTFSVTGYLFFAYLFWPLWFPLSAICFDQTLYSSKIAWSCLIGGICWFLIFGYWLLHAMPSAQLTSKHITYSHHPTFTLNFIGTTLLYLLLVSLPYILSSYSILKCLGALLIISCIIYRAVSTGK